MLEKGTFIYEIGGLYDMATALFLGKFQPFHKGHLKVLKEIAKNYKEIVIAIGSSNVKNKPDNPFTATQRQNMIMKAVEEANIKTDCWIVNVPDINNDKRYVIHTEEHTPHFDIIYTGNELNIKLFRAAGHKVKAIDEKKRYYGISSTKIREAISKGKKWDHMVPPSVAKEIKKIGLSKIKKLVK